jgi:hypothetical protein
VSVLVLNGTAYACRRGGHALPRRVGSKPVSFGGEETTSLRAELMVVPLVLVQLTPAQAATVRALFANGAQVDCSGDVFNNASATVTCSATISDEFEPAGPWFSLSMTLYEIGTDLGYAGSGETRYALTDTPSDQGGGVLEANPDGSPWDGQCFRVLDAETPTPCGSGSCAILYSSVPERTWLTVPLAAGTLTGEPIAYFASKGINGLSGIDYQSTKGILYHVRGGVDLTSWESPYVAGSWSGGLMTLTFGSGFLVSIQEEDRFRLELWGRLSLLPGATDPQPYVLARQTICYPGHLHMPGSVTPLVNP